MTSTPVATVVESRTSPAGRKPLSRSTSHSYPTVSSGPVQTFGVLETSGVLRQKRSCPSAAGTSTETTLLRLLFTMNAVPLSAFSGLGPSGLIGRGSRQVPVHTPASGSILASACVSL